MMITIYEQENQLFEKWKKEFTNNGDSDFCCDGLIFNGDLCNNSYNAESGSQEDLWREADRKILFFMKEPNDNADEDYREWGLEGDTKHPFFRFIYSWLVALSNINAEDQEVPQMTKTFPKQLPLLIVNAKKKSGGASANNDVVYHFAEQYKHLLRAQFDIYAPNIIVCGGGPTNAANEVLLLRIVKDLIYPDVKFTQMENSNWIWYSVEKNIVLINSFHPVSRETNDNKFNTLVDHYQSFLRLKLIK